MAGIKDAIVEILRDNAEVRDWATGGIHARRAPAMTSGGLRDKYIVVRVTDSNPDEWHSQTAPAGGTLDKIAVAIWCEGSKEADIGANKVRIALDGMAGTAANIGIQRIFWRGTVDREVEDASEAEQLLDACIAEFEVGYILPT
jgi:hypothetical protein